MVPLEYSFDIILPFAPWS